MEITKQYSQEIQMSRKNLNLKRLILKLEMEIWKSWYSLQILQL